MGSLVPRPPHPAFVTCSMKSGEGLEGFIMWYVPRLMSCSVCLRLVCSLPFTLLSLNSICSFCSVCPASPIATGLIVASYSTWRQLWHASRDKYVQAFPHFRTASDKSWAWRPGNEASYLACWCIHSCMCVITCILKSGSSKYPRGKGEKNFQGGKCS